MCECENKKTRINNVVKKLELIETMYEESMQRKFLEEQTIEQLEYGIADIENRNKEAINLEKNEDGKAKYSNQELRDIALFKVLQDNQGYQELKNKLAEKRNLIRIEIKELDVMSKKLKILELMLKAEEIVR